MRRAGYTWIAGVDEAGRGALAGPVVAAAVVLGPDDPQIPGVDDSKRLDSATRTRLAHHVRRAHRHAVVAVAADAIDRSNIRLATRRAMRRALGRLPQAPDAVLVDAVRLGDDLGAPVLPLIKGDALSYAIAAASVLAKVARDAMMTTLDRRHPHYGFADHKGYGAARHREALRRYGPTAEHRLSFRTVVPRRDDDRRRARAPMRARAHAAASPPLPRVR
ncbi:MAG: ribonuclease HII [Acidobacteriota bacterium]